MKVLLVDDDVAIRELVPAVLLQAGYDDVLVAASASEAIAIIQIQCVPIDCFILDIQMPGDNGIDLCRALRSLPHLLHAPIIMLTAMHGKDFIDEAFAAGATDYTTKPFDIGELCKRVQLAEFTVNRRNQEDAGLSSSMNNNGVSPVLGHAELSEKHQLYGVKGLIPVYAFENYIKQLSRANQNVSNIFAIRIELIHHLHEIASPKEFHAALTAVANIVTESMKEVGFVMTYDGQGVFICKSKSVSPPCNISLERNIECQLERQSIAFANGDRMGIQVAVGPSVFPSVFGPGSYERLKELAIAGSMSRILERQSQENPLGFSAHYI